MEKTMNISKDMFEFAQLDTTIHDEKFKTKARGYFADAFLRFKKNKSSVVAAFIIGILVLFSVFAPIISPYTVYDKNNEYVNYPPYIEGMANLGIGILDGGVTMGSQNALQLAKLEAIGAETGYDVILGEPQEVEIVEIYRGQERITYSYNVTVNKYHQKGVIYMVISEDEYKAIQSWQDQTGIQVLYPVVEQKDIYQQVPDIDVKNTTRNSNVWYQVSDAKGTPIRDANGNYLPAYSTNTKLAYSVDGDYVGEYTSNVRVAGDNGDYVYATAKSGSLECRVCYYNYYQFKYGKAPTYLMGTDEYGRDLFCAIGQGARFSLIFAVIVSAINLTLGVIYGAIEGYYGGVVDMTLERVSDILSGVPFMVVATLFQLHLAQKVGIVPSFLFAFVLTGWIGMAALTRKQFYRFKGQEYVMAAKTLGASDKRIMFKHILPNSLGTMVTSCALVIPGVISSETNLTYLGIINLSSIVGTSVGELMSLGQNAMAAAPHAMLFPALFLSLLLISFNLFGNGLRDAFNPSTRGAED